MSYPIHTRETVPEAAQETLGNVEKAFGFVPNLIGIMAEAPAVAKAYPTLNHLFGETSFSAAERHVVLLTVSYANECSYCVAAHSTGAHKQGVSEDIVDALRDGRELADPKLEALRRFTAEVVSTRGWPSDATLQAFFDAGYGRQQVLEVMLGRQPKDAVQLREPSGRDSVGRGVRAGRLAEGRGLTARNGHEVSGP